MLSMIDMRIETMNGAAQSIDDEHAKEPRLTVMLASLFDSPAAGYAQSSSAQFHSV
jgi:hypothetical protein